MSFAFPLLLGMQAAGMITDFIGARSQEELMNQGRQIDQAGLEANLAQTQLQAQDESLNAMKELRQTMGSQIAYMAARGTASGAGNAVTALNESIGNFNQDEKVRKMNLLGKENQLKGKSALSQIQYNTDSSALWQGFSSRTFNRFPSSLSGWKQAISDAKKGFALK